MDLLALSRFGLGWTPELSDLQLESSLTFGRRGLPKQGWHPPDYVAEQLKKGDLKFAIEEPEGGGELPAHPQPVALEPVRLQRRRATSTSCKSPARHRPRPATAARSQTRGASAQASSSGPRRLPRRQARLADHDRLPDDQLDAHVSDVVLPAATWYEKHDLSSTTDMHPFVHSFNPAIAPPWQTKTDWETWKTIARRLLGVGRRPPRHSARMSSPSRCGTTLPRQWPPSTVWCETGGPARSIRSRARLCPVLAVAERDFPAIYDKMIVDRPADGEGRACSPRALPYDVKREIEHPAAAQWDVRRWWSRRRATEASRPTYSVGRRDPASCRGRPTATSSTQGFKMSWRSAPGMKLARSGRPSTRASRSPSPTPRLAPVPVITSPEWSGSESGGRRYSAVHDQYRATQALPHLDGSAAVLPRSRLDDRYGRGTCRYIARP
jgi:nitrate reductase alpha subunit